MMNKFLLTIILCLAAGFICAQTAEVEDRGPHNLAELYEMNVGFGEVSWKWNEPGKPEQYEIEDPTAFEIPDSLCVLTLEPRWICPDGTERVFSPETVELKFVVPQYEDVAVEKDGIARAQKVEGEFTAEELDLINNNWEPLFFENFEGGTSTENSWTGVAGIWTFENKSGRSGSIWGVGDPKKYGPMNPPDIGSPNDEVAGTMSCSYLPMDDDWLISPLITIPHQGTNSPVLQMKMWYEFEYYYDKLELYLSADGQDFEFADAVVGSKSKGGWVQYTLDLSEYRGSNIKLGFRLKSDGSYHYGGWFIDQVGIYNMGDPTAGSVQMAFALPLIYGGYVVAGAVVGAVGLMYYSHVQLNNIDWASAGGLSYDLTPNYQAKRLSSPRDVFIVWDATNPNISEQQKQLAFVLNMMKYHFAPESQVMFGVYDGGSIEIMENEIFSGPKHREAEAPDFPFYDAVVAKVKEVKAATPNLKPEVEIWRAFLEKIYKKGNKGTPETDPELEPLKKFYGTDYCTNSIILTSIEHGLGAAGAGLNELSELMEQDGHKLFGMISGTNSTGNAPAAVASAIGATGGVLLQAAEVVGNAVEDNPADEIKNKLCGSALEVEIELFGSPEEDDDFVSNYQYDWIDGRVRVASNFPQGGVTLKIKGDRLKFGKLLNEEQIIDVELDPGYKGYKVDETKDEISIVIIEEDTWYYFFVTAHNRYASDTKESIELYDSDGKLVQKKDLEVIVEQLVLYRGLIDQPHPLQSDQNTEAKAGRVKPLGWDNDGHCSLPSHVLGRNISIFSSWTLNPHQCIRYMFKRFTGIGIQLKGKFDKDESLANEVYFTHNREYLNIGFIGNLSHRLIETSRNIE